jgi:hypothetical protein
MGMFGNLLGGGGDIVSGLMGIEDAGKQKSRARDAQARYYDNLELQRANEANMDFTPAYVGDSIGPYQRSSSPVARSYLESLMTGQNKQAASSPWADPTAGQRAENAFEEAYGPYEALVARGARERSATPWETKRPGPIDTSAVDGEKMLRNEDGHNASSRVVRPGSWERGR